MFSGVFMFLSFVFEGTGLLSSPRRGRAIRFRTKGTEPDFRAGGRRSAEQCSDTNHFVARNCSGATRSAESRRLNTTKINAAWMNNRLLTERVVGSLQWRSNAWLAIFTIVDWPISSRCPPLRIYLAPVCGRGAQRRSRAADGSPPIIRIRSDVSS